VGAIKREPTPSGPITDLFDRLHEIHLEAGQPSVREIAVRIGRGAISSSTIHNIFRGPRVPKWGFLELVVEALHGDTAEFLKLWQAARRVEVAAGTGNNFAWTSLPGNGKPAAPLLNRAMSVSNPASAARAEPSAHGPIQRIWSTEIPRRNPHFTGRIGELHALRANLTRDDRPHPAAQLISGTGGVGKTEIATEYIHLHRDKYEIIWWIRAEHTDRVRDALVKLGQRLEVRPAGTEGGRDRTIAAVLDALASGVRPNWLLVYDNAAQLPELQRYLPTSLPGGHIIITSRQQNWPAHIEKDIVGISPFTEAEAIDFLRRRVPVLGANRMLKADEDKRRTSGAARLAEALGHLPIAVEHAAAYLTETGQTVDDYLSRFSANAHRMFSEQDSDYPASVSATWAVSTALLTHDAGHLLNLCAFFSPEPIAVELLLDHAQAVSAPSGLGEFLSSPSRFRAAASHMHRLSLVKVDGAQDQIQMHRVVQAVTRSQLRQNWRDMFQAYRTAVDIMLAESNPDHPDQADNDATYDLSLQHLVSERNFFNTSNPALRRLIIDQVRRLHLRGRHMEAMRFGQDALNVWRERLGRDHLHVLTMAVEVTIALRILGYAAEARELSRETLQLLRKTYEDEHEITLLCINTQGADLRSRAQFGDALELDMGLLPKFERIYGPDHERTLNVRNNLAADYRRLGRLHEALETDQRTFEVGGASWVLAIHAP
jgi:Tetratricopeptide repeat/NB-ARC domain